MTLGHLLTLHRIVPALSAGDRWGVLEELVNVLVEEGSVEVGHRDSVLAALRMREETMSTGIGFGVAIPHASSEHVREVVAVFDLPPDHGGHQILAEAGIAAEDGAGE